VRRNPVLLLTIGGVLLVSSTAGSQSLAPPPYLSQWGVLGAGSGQFRSPDGVAVDANGNVFVADAGNDRVQKFSPNGVPLGQIAGTGASGGLLSGPHGVAVDQAGFIYIADTNNNRIQKYSPACGFVAQWGTGGTAEGQFDGPMAVAVGPTGEIHVADVGNRRIQVFSSSGAFLRRLGSAGSGVGQFNMGPMGVAVDAAGNVYATEQFVDGIWEFSPDGLHVRRFNIGLPVPYEPVGDLRGLAVDGANLYVADQALNTVDVFQLVGGFLYQLGAAAGSGNGQFRFPTGVAADAVGNLYVVDGSNNRLQKFGTGATGSRSSSWGRLKRLYR
jgi:sugar lactone lactonase YvrE